MLDVRKASEYEPDMATLTSTLRRAIQQCGMTRYQLSKVSGVGQDILSKFMRGGGIKLETADRLCELLGLKLVQVNKPSKGKGR